MNVFRLACMIGMLFFHLSLVADTANRLVEAERGFAASPREIHSRGDRGDDCQPLGAPIRLSSI